MCWLAWLGLAWGLLALRDVVVLAYSTRGLMNIAQASYFIHLGNILPPEDHRVTGAIGPHHLSWRWLQRGLVCCWALCFVLDWARWDSSLFPCKMPGGPLWYSGLLCWRQGCSSWLGGSSMMSPVSQATPGSGVPKPSQFTPASVSP